MRFLEHDESPLRCGQFNGRIDHQGEKIVKHGNGAEGPEDRKKVPDFVKTGK